MLNKMRLHMRCLPAWHAVPCALLRSLRMYILKLDQNLAAHSTSILFSPHVHEAGQRQGDGLRKLLNFYLQFACTPCTACAHCQVATSTAYLTACSGRSVMCVAATCIVLPNVVLPARLLWDCCKSFCAGYSAFLPLGTAAPLYCLPSTPYHVYCCTQYSNTAYPIGILPA
jgi:hypothetical protein